MYCNNCGTRVPEDSSFCNKCGKPINILYNSNPASEVEFDMVNDLYLSTQNNTSNYDQITSTNIENDLSSSQIYDEDKKYKKIRKVMLLIILIIALFFVLKGIILYKLDQQNLNERFDLTPVLHDISYLENIGLSSKTDYEHIIIEYDLNQKTINNAGVNIIMYNDKIVYLSMSNPEYSFMNLYVGQYSGLINNSRIANYIENIFKQNSIQYKRSDPQYSDGIRYILDDNYTIEINSKNNRIDSIKYSIDTFNFP